MANLQRTMRRKWQRSISVDSSSLGGIIFVVSLMAIVTAAVAIWAY